MASVSVETHGRVCMWALVNLGLALCLGIKGFVPRASLAPFHSHDPAHKQGDAMAVSSFCSLSRKPPAKTESCYLKEQGSGPLLF